MPRPIKCRRVCSLPQTKEFAPTEQVAACPLEPVIMSVDEYEVIRLIDLESLTQEQCAQQMNIARTTVTGIYNEARKKIAEALVYGKRLLIDGGNFTLCDQKTVCGLASVKHCCKQNRIHDRKEE